jgi:cytochrome c-type protein NapB
MNAHEPLDHHHTAGDLLPGRLQRFAPLLAAIGVGVALVGFLSGMREPPDPVRPPPPAKRPAANAPAAVKYSELPTATIRPNAAWSPRMSELRFEKPGIFDTVTRTNEMKLAAVADRARNRAYDGAPPTIPHPVESRSAAACLACHGEGIKVGDRIASRISHVHLSNCIQCHIEQSPEHVANEFRGVARAGPGPRANPGAPPGMPHPTFMRENCAACHGLIARAGLRTTHPWLTSCTQCHAPSAALDQINFAEGTP